MVQKYLSLYVGKALYSSVENVKVQNGPAEKEAAARESAGVKVALSFILYVITIYMP